MNNEEKTLGQVARSSYDPYVIETAAWDHVAQAVITEHERRKAEQVKPEWKLPDPPAGMEWHRTDWTAEMLPEGYRPLLATEHTAEGDDISGNGRVWTRHIGGDWDKSAGEDRGWFQRTTRPLQVKPEPFATEKAAFAAGKTIQCKDASTPWMDCESTPCWYHDVEYRVKPEPVMVELGPDDVKCGDELTSDGGKHRAGITGVNPNGVCITSGNIGWDFMKVHHKINRHDGKGWVPCSKPKQD